VATGTGVIEGFEVLMIGPGFYLVTAIMHAAPPVQVGLFESVEDIDSVCERLMKEQKQRLN
jgi:hypothetical protein